MSTRSSTSDSYIVVLDEGASTIRALLFDSGARLMEGFGARLPRVEGAAEDCLEEAERQAREAGFQVGFKVDGAAPLPPLARLCIGTGCVDSSRHAITIGEVGAIAAFHDDAASGKILPDAANAYREVRKSLGLAGSIEPYLESAEAGDPKIAPLSVITAQLREAHNVLCERYGLPEEIVLSGPALLKSPAWMQMIVDALGRPAVVCTEPEPLARGAAIWALKQIGGIKQYSALPASLGATLQPKLQTQPKLQKQAQEQRMNQDLQERAARVRMLLMDVDGVLTDAKLYNVPGPDGKMWETKGFDAQDGIALQWMSWYKIETGVISGRISPATEERARQVKMTHVYQGHIEKIPILHEIEQKSGIALGDMAYIGDDLTDIVVMRRVGLAFAPANARPEVKRAAHHVLTASGGNGAVREVCELLLQAKGYWAELLKKYEVE